MEFRLVSDFKPCGDQPKAIDELVEGVLSGKRYQSLLGVTGSGKTFTIANAIVRVKRPVLVISHNKTLAAQLYGEFKQFFPHNAVEYFVSYYDYYQPEAYIPQTDTYIEKDASINDELDRLRLSATAALSSRDDVIIVSSVSCIYNLGSPDDYKDMLLRLKVGQDMPLDLILSALVDIHYERNDIDFSRGTFQVRGDTIEIFPAYDKLAVRVEFFADTIEAISLIEPLTKNLSVKLDKITIYPGKHFVTTKKRIEAALISIRDELNARLKELNSQNKALEAQRLESRTNYDMEMLKEIGYCHGVENYSRHLSARPAGSRPYTLIDYFRGDFLTVIDESHVSIPQIRGMYEGDRSRKLTLVEHGFRLPSCLDNRPLRFEEFEGMIRQAVFVSATLGNYETTCSRSIVEQFIRPTGLLEPEVIIRPSKGQVDDIIALVRARAKKKERVLITTLTKRMAEDLAAYLNDMGLSVQYMHSDLGAIERVRILEALRRRKFDCLVGINLLREGLDLPEVSLVCILDADKEGFLRSAASLIQISGRAARNINSQVIMYADTMTGSMKRAIDETVRRRKTQLEFNKRHNITPKGIEKSIRISIDTKRESENIAAQPVGESIEQLQAVELIAELNREMEQAARNLQFEKAAYFRDEIKKLQGKKPGPVRGC